VVPVVLAELVVLAALVVQATSRRNCRPVAMRAISGSTTRSIAVALPMGIVERRTVLAVRLAETRLPIVKPTPGNRLAVREAILPVVIATDKARVAAIARQELVELIVSEAAISRVVVAEIALPSTVVPEGTADRVHAPAAAVAAIVWDPVAVVAAAPVAVGGGKHGSQW
jgi:hypothetical protein